MAARLNRIIAASAIAAAIAAPSEGIKLTPYYDPGGVLTVCMGSTRNIERRLYSIDECKARLNTEMRQAVEAVERCRPGLPTNVLAAFGDAVFNLGPAIACDTKHSTAARLLAAGDIPGACEQLPRWNKARVFGVMTELPGLTKRRYLERSVCLSPE